MSALSKMLATKPTNKFRASHVPAATKICHEPKEVGLRGFGVLREHCHDILVRTIFTCGDAEYPAAAKNAEKMLFDILFAQAKTNIRAAISAIYGNDTQDALKHLEAALREMEP